MSAKLPTQKQLQVGEQIKRVIADIFATDSNLSFPNTYITITEADVSPNIKNCKILTKVSGEIERSKIIAFLNKNINYFRRLLSAKMDLRHTPELTFIPDVKGDKTSKINDLLESESKKFQ